jgi:hypothetical protein
MSTDFSCATCSTNAGVRTAVGEGRTIAPWFVIGTLHFCFLHHFICLDAKKQQRLLSSYPIKKRTPLIIQILTRLGLNSRNISALKYSIKPTFQLRILEHSGAYKREYRQKKTLLSTSRHQI